MKRLITIVTLLTIGAGCARKEPDMAVQTAVSEAEKAPEPESGSKPGVDAPDGSSKERPRAKREAAASPALECATDDCKKACEPYGETLAQRCAQAWADGCFEKPRKDRSKCEVPESGLAKKSAESRSAKGSGSPVAADAEPPPAPPEEKPPKKDDPSLMPELFGDK